MKSDTIANLKQSLDLAGEMLRLSEKGMAECEDDGCLVVYGILRDCAYRINESATAELNAHKIAEVS